MREFYHRNRSFWYFLFLFHIGFYLLILWHVWLFITAVTLPFESAGIGGLVFGHVATGLSLIEGSGILIKRVVDGELSIIFYGGLAELIVNAMVDLEQPFIQWEWH